MFLRSIAFALATLFFAVPAHATVVDYSGDNVIMGQLASNQKGKITGATVASVVTGSLPAGYSVVFEYAIQTTPGATFTQTAGGDWKASVTGNISYNYTDTAGHFYGGSMSATTGAGYSYGYVNGSASVPLVLASANIDTNKRATVTLTNLSSTSATFSLIMSSLARFAGDGVKISYRVLSAVPLPGSVYMFGLALAAMFFFGARRRKQALVG